MKIGQRILLSYIRTKFKILSAISKKKAAQAAFMLFRTPASRDTKELPALFRQAEDLHFKFGEFDIVGYRWNKGGTRRALILHGFESSSVNFSGYVGPLIEKGYEVLAFDSPAHGRSSGKTTNVLVYRDMIKHICGHYGPIQSYVAHSFGGLAVCLAMAELPHDENYRLALIAPAAETTTAIDNFFHFLRLDEKIRPEFDNVIIAMGGHPVSWFSIGRAMKTIKAKILWLNDEEDFVTPIRDALKVKEENYPNLELVFTKGLGHSRIYRDDKIIRRVVDFL